MFQPPMPSLRSVPLRWTLREVRSRALGRCYFRTPQYLAALLASLELWAAALLAKLALWPVHSLGSRPWREPL